MHSVHALGKHDVVPTADIWLQGHPPLSSLGIFGVMSLAQKLQRARSSFSLAEYILRLTGNLGVHQVTFSTVKIAVIYRIV